jgi:hypothetical protein
MTAQLAGIGAIIGLVAWLALNFRHRRAVTRWAQTRSRARITWDDQPRAVIGAAVIVVALGLGLALSARWAFGLTVLLTGAGCVVESAVRVVPHLRASEQRLAMDHIVMSLPLLVALGLAVTGWNRLPPLIAGT